VHLGAVVEVGVPVAAPLRGEVHEVPDGSEHAALADIGGHARMRGVEVAEGAVGVAGGNGNGGVLTPFAVFAAEVVLEGVVAGAEEAQLVPAARASVGAQSGEISGSDDGEPNRGFAFQVEQALERSGRQVLLSHCQTDDGLGRECNRSRCPL